MDRSSLGGGNGAHCVYCSVVYVATGPGEMGRGLSLILLASRQKDMLYHGMWTPLGGIKFSSFFGCKN
jgi:hypothetical protein